MFDFSAQLSIALAENKISLTSTAKKKLLLYTEILQKWNRVFNLTTISNPHDMIYLHLIDSLIIFPYLQGHRFLDVGSGAGLPGIPLAILDPSKQWVLIDKNNKKTRFLTQVIAELALKNVEVVKMNCEDYHPDDCFDGIVSRAFTSLCLFCEKTAHLLCPQGVLLAMKGKYPQEELDDIPPHFLVQDIIRLNIKGMDVKRHVVCLMKKED